MVIVAWGVVGLLRDEAVVQDCACFSVLGNAQARGVRLFGGYGGIVQIVQESAFRAICRIRTNEANLVAAGGNCVDLRSIPFAILEKRRQWMWDMFDST
jgi:hypothetical protein